MLGTTKDQARLLVKRAVITGGLEVSSVLAGLGLFGSARGRGAIFTLHHVRPLRRNDFRPNDLLDVTPDFLEAAILALANEGYDFIRLEDTPERLSGKPGRPFACFTLDDGYRDNAIFAAAIFARHRAPFTMFLNSGFFGRTRTMWWETLDALLNRTDQITFDFGQGAETLLARTSAQKLSAFNRISTHINTADEREAVARLDREALRQGLDPSKIVAELTLAEAELKRLFTGPLVSYGGHTVSHRGIARLPDDEAESEIAGSLDAIAAITESRPKSFAYPYGDARSFAPRERQTLKRLGVDIAVTTHPGTLRPEMTSNLTALPRISLNGLYQKARYVRALASGIPFKLTG